jgi:hypothetical protein
MSVSLIQSRVQTDPSSMAGLSAGGDDSTSQIAMTLIKELLPLLV